MLLEIVKKEDFDWSSLAQLTPYSLFAEAKVIQACMDVFEHEYFFAVLKDEEQVLAALPLVKVDGVYMPSGYYGDQDMLDFVPLSFLNKETAVELLNQLLNWANENNEKLLLREIPNEIASNVINGNKHLDAIIPATNIDLNSQAKEGKPIYKKKHRKEMRRKFNRIESEKISIKIDYAVEKTDEIKAKFFEFFSRSSNDEKQKFIQTKAVEYFRKFVDFEQVKMSAMYFNESLVSILLYIENNPKWFVDKEDRRIVYLYNMTSDTEFYDYSPGLIHVNSMIMDVINKGYDEFNFLRGAERYKFEIGANACKWNIKISN